MGRSRVFSQLKNDRGSVLAFALIGVVVAGVIISYVASSYASSKRVQAKINFLNLVAQLQLNIRNTVNSDPAWQTTIAYPPNNAVGSPTMTDCFAKFSCASPASPQKFTLWPALPDTTDLTQAIFDGLNSSAGFTLNGDKCDATTGGFLQSAADPNFGNPKCPISVRLRWSVKPGCVSQATCIAVITADILYSPGPNPPLGAINAQNYSFTFDQAGPGYCAGAPALAEQLACTHPPSTKDYLYCTTKGWKCGQVYQPQP